MQTYRLALIGFGNVGQGFAEILRDRSADLAQRFGVEFQIVAAVTKRPGGVNDSAYAPGGLDPAALLAAVNTPGGLASLSVSERDWEPLRLIRESNADIVVEVSPTDLQTGEPATTHIRAALEAGKHVVTTNKGPVALHYAELSALARAQGKELGVEGTVMSGTPVLRLGRELLSAAGIFRLQGILNGTTNYILTQMEAGAGYADALAEAQARGYAETDPTGDVEGHDAAGKVVILANLFLGAALAVDQVDRQGITGLTSADIAAARAAGERWKLIGRLEWHDGQVKASVRPTRLPLAHPLAGVSGATNALTFSTSLLGEVTLVGAGAGRVETGFAILGDLLAIHRKVAV
jgi:homoserine dehydrogenase